MGFIIRSSCFGCLLLALILQGKGERGRTVNELKLFQLRYNKSRLSCKKALMPSLIIDVTFVANFIQVLIGCGSVFTL